MMVRPAAALIVLVLCASGVTRPPSASQAAQPPLTFRVDVNYVEVDVSVTDAKGEFVRDLRKEDFEVREDSRMQQLSAVSLVDIPIASAAPRPSAASRIEPDVQTNARDFDGRVYVLVLDDLHTDPLRSRQVRAAARGFVERHLGANDLAAVVHASGSAASSQTFTASPRVLLAAIDRFVGRKPRAATLERLDDFFSVRRRPDEQPNDVRIGDPVAMERGDLARVLLETLGNVSDSLASVRGRRKALVLFSEGIDYNINDLSDGHFTSMVGSLTRETIAAATRANMGIYAVDPRGLTALGDDVMEITELPSPEYYKLDIGPGGLQGEVRRSQDSLRVLAEETGGIAAVDTNSLSGLFDRVVRDSSTYYVLGYHSSDARRDGKFRRVEVIVRRPGVQVRARNGYVAARGPSRARAIDASTGTSAALLEALQNPLPIGGLKLTTFAAPFKAASGAASVVVGVEIDAANLRLAEEDGRLTNSYELSLVALDREGKTRDGSRLSVPLKLRPETRDEMRKHGFRLLTRLELPPDRYQLRLAALEGMGGSVGSVHQEIEVPDFSVGRLAMSGMLVTSASAKATPTTDSAVRPIEGLPAPPTARREFAVTDSLACFVEVYDNTVIKSDLAFVTTLRTADGSVAFRSSQTGKADGYNPASTYGVSVRIPLRDLKPGPYVLRMEASAPEPGAAPVRRETLIHLVPATAGDEPRR